MAGEGILKNLTAQEGFGSAVSGIGSQLGGVISNIDASDGKVSMGGQAAGSALQFASAGLALGPIGALAGGIIGGVVGLVKGKKMQEEQEKQQAQQKWNAAVASKPNPAASDVSAVQYGQRGGGTTYLQNKFGIPDPSILSQMTSIQ